MTRQEQEDQAQLEWLRKWKERRKEKRDVRKKSLFYKILRKLGIIKDYEEDIRTRMEEMMPMEKRLEENNVKNENDRKKTYLRAYRKHGKRIKRIESEIEEIRNMKMYPSSNNDGMPHGSNQSDLSSYAAALQEREDKLYQEGVKQVQTYKDIEYRINELDDQDERDVMFYRYIKGFEWWQIAQLMEYSESWIYELHGRALKNIQIN